MLSELCPGLCFLEDLLAGYRVLKIVIVTLIEVDNIKNGSKDKSISINDCTKIAMTIIMMNNNKEAIIIHKMRR